MDMPTPPVPELVLETEATDPPARSKSWAGRKLRLSVAAILAIILLAGAVAAFLSIRAGGGFRSWSIGTTQDAATLSASDLANLERRLFMLRPGTEGFSARAEKHLQILSTLKLVKGRGGVALDQHLVRFVATIEREVGQGDAVSAYDFAEQGFGLIENRGARQSAARRLAMFTMVSKLNAVDRLERLFRIWSAVDAGCLKDGRVCDRLTEEFAFYFSAYAQVDLGAEQAAFLLARRITDPARRAAAYRQLGSLIMRPTMRVQTDSQLSAASELALKEKRWKGALAAAAAVSNHAGSSRDNMLRLVSSRLLDSGATVDGLDAALAISDPAVRDTALLHVVNAGSLGRYLHEAQIAQRNIVDPDKRTIAKMLIGFAFAKLGYTAQARPYIADSVGAVSAMTSGAGREVAAAYGMRAAAEAGDTDAAERLLKLATQPGKLRDDAIASLADAFANDGNARAMAELASGTRGAVAGDILGRAAAILARSGNIGQAEHMVAGAPDDDAWLHAASVFAANGDFSDEWLAKAKARFSKLTIDDPSLWNGEGFANAAFMTAEGDLKRSTSRLPLIADMDLRARAARGLANAYLRKADYRSAKALLEQFAASDLKRRDALKASMSQELVRLGAIRLAAYTVRSIGDANTRVKAFHSIARLQANRLDRFRALKGQIQPDVPDGQRTYKPQPAVERYVYTTFDVKQQSLGNYIPRLPDSDMSDGNAVRRDLPPIDGGGQMDIVPLANNDYNKKFLTAIPMLDDWTPLGATIVMAAQSTRHPSYLHVNQGRLDLPQLWEQLVLRGQSDFLLRDGRDYTLRAPLFVSTGSTLVISASDVASLRLSTERATFIVNAGDMRLADVTLVGWTEKTGTPTPMTYDSRQEFRPFYIAWSNSRTQAVGSHFLNLGYAAGKAYGMTLTNGPYTILQRNVTQVRPPSGTFIENSFEEMLYGFYSYEAYDVQVVGNEYRNNIVYGIDPHDRSHKLLFSYNTAYGSHKKHGIIGSRNVEDSWFIGNLTFDNKGSGMMMDRYAGRNIMYANTAFDNHANGISIYESPCNILSSNRVFNNGRSGITVRNSWDVGLFHNDIVHNRNVGIEGYALEFVTKVGQPSRNLLLDPYEQFLSIAAVSNEVKDNKQGGVAMTGMGAMLLQGNRLVGSAKRMFLNDLRLAERDVSSRQAGGIMVAGGCPRPKRAYSCPFVQQHFLSRELALAPLGGRPFPTCPGKTIVNAATQQNAQSVPLDDEVEEEAADPVITAGIEQ